MQGRFVIIKDCAKIADGAVVAPGTVVPSMTVFGGQPAKFVSELPETWPELMEAQRCVLFPFICLRRGGDGGEQERADVGSRASLSKQIFNNVHVS